MICFLIARWPQQSGSELQFCQDEQGQEVVWLTFDLLQIVKIVRFQRM